VEQFIEGCFSWPSCPASVLLLLVCAYWILMVFGAVDLDFLDLDLDLNVDVELDGVPAILQAGFIPLKFLNIGSVPTMLWVSIFSLACWMVSRLWNSPSPHPSFQWSADTTAILRDSGVAVMLTKVITQPLRGRFDPVEPNRVEDLVGRTCKVTTSEVTDAFGEAELATDGAPLRLKIRNSSGTLHKGDPAVIVEFHTSENTWFVEPLPVRDELPH